MDYDNDTAAYEHIRRYGIHRTKKSGPRKGKVVHETASGKTYKGTHRETTRFAKEEALLRAKKK